MKNTLKKVMVVVMAFALLVGATAVPTQNAQAASNGYMGSLKLNWDLKKNKTLKYQSAANVLKKVNGKVKITNYKITDAKKSGYKNLTFTITFRPNYNNMTNAQIHKMAAIATRGGNIGAGCWFSVADYDTGLSLEKKSSRFNVTVKSSQKKINKKKYTDSHKCWIKFWGFQFKVSITYPEDYDGLCIGVGGYNQLSGSTTDAQYWLGKRRVTFGQTSFYKKGKKNSHWMRVRASKKTTSTDTTEPQTTATPAPTTSPS